MSIRKPKTYNEASILARCMEVKKYSPDITEEMLESMYNFMMENKKNQIGLANNTIYFINENGDKTEAYTVQMIAGLAQLVFGYTFFNIRNFRNPGSSSDGGCSSNNNNNNNNNNG